MEADKGYQPLYKTLTISGRQHHVVDQRAFNNKASEYYHRALTLIEADCEQAKCDNLVIQWDSKIIDYLTLATDLGHGHAPMLLAQNALTQKKSQGISESQILTFLQLAADRQDMEAAYQLGCAYALTGCFTEIEALIAQYALVTDTKRGQLATHYLTLAATTQHSGAIQALTMAYAYGSGFIARDVEQLITLFTTLSHQGNQTVALTFGTWLMGMTETACIDKNNQADYNQRIASGLPYLLMAASGKDILVAQKALQYICALIAHHHTDAELVNNLFKPQLIQAAEKDNALLAFYFMWYSLDPTEKPLAPEFMQAYDCSVLEELINPCAEQAVHYFDLVLKGDNTMLIEIAHSFSGCVFSDYLDN